MEWRKGAETLRDGDRYTLKQDGAVCELQIRSLVIADAGEYLCTCGEEKTSATLTIRGKDHMCSRVWVPRIWLALCLNIFHPPFLIVYVSSLSH